MGVSPNNPCEPAHQLSSRHRRRSQSVSQTSPLDLRPPQTYQPPPMPNQPIRWGILGNAKIGRDHLAAAIHQSLDGSLCAIASSNPQQARTEYRRYGDLHYFSDYEQMLRSDVIDAVYIPLPNHMHHPWSLMALQCGKAVLCEKPMALSADQVKELIQARDRTGLLCAEAYMVVHHPQWQQLRQFIQRQELGELAQVSAAFSFNNSEEIHNIRNQAATGGGALRDIGVYPLGTTRFVTDSEPKAVRAHIDWDNGIDATARVDCDFPGFNLNFYCSMRMGLRQEVVFHFQRGWLRLDAPFNPGVYQEPTWTIRDSRNNYRIQRFPLIDQYELQFSAFNHALLTGNPFPCPLEFSYHNQLALDAIYHSAPGSADF